MLHGYYDFMAVCSVAVQWEGQGNRDLLLGRIVDCCHGYTTSGSQAHMSLTVLQDCKEPSKNIDIDHRPPHIETKAVVKVFKEALMYYNSISKSRNKIKPLTNLKTLGLFWTNQTS